MGKLVGPPLAAFLFSGILFALLLAPAPRSVYAAETPAYVALGDSLAFGVGAANPGREGYVAVTYDALSGSDRYRQRGLALVNLSAPGATSEDLLLPGGQLERAISEIKGRQQNASSADDSVEIISINIGANDLLSLAAQGSPCISDAAADACLKQLGEVLSGLQNSLSQVLQRLHEAAPDAQICAIDLYNPFSGTGDLRESLANVGVQQVNGVIRALTSDAKLGDAKLGVQLVSVFSLFQGRGKQWIAGDGLHPNSNGYRALSEALLSAIERRPLHLPDDLAAVPTDVPGAIAAVPDVPQASSRSSNDWLLLGISVIAAFGAGVFIAGAYFLARGRG
jgi:lysophospholipase L1-like esterase